MSKIVEMAGENTCEKPTKAALVEHALKLCAGWLPPELRLPGMNFAQAEPDTAQTAE